MIANLSIDVHSFECVSYHINFEPYFYEKYLIPYNYVQTNDYSQIKKNDFKEWFAIEH